ncbi:MAG TPA: non-heme iron oxygenase ferredoxin subunit [Steroidobacteraceae bacterium]|nr:non-heme iron oxygenase ferredoxin subunit [Steroidobacteraceae bacterium]
MSSRWIDVGPADAVPPGEYRVFDIDDTPIAVFNVAGELFAIHDICTHDGEILTGGPVEGTEIVCPRHGARFSLRTGEVLAPPAYEAVRTFGIRIENGRLLLEADA